MGDEEMHSWLLYDGFCPLCRRYASHVRLQQTLGLFSLENMRERSDLVAEVRRLGFDPATGMILRLRGRYYHGEQCLHMIALLSTPIGWFNRLNAALFRSEWLCRFIYPLLAVGRRLLLVLLGRSQTLK